MTWNKCTIGDLCDSVSITYRGNAKKVVLINTSDVFDGKILNHDFVANEGLKGQFKKTFAENDILYSEIRPANRRFAFVDFCGTKNYIASTKLMVIRPRTDKVRPRFLYAILTAQTVIDELQHLAETRSGTFPQITFNGEVAPIPVRLPSFEAQDAIVSIIDSIDGKIDENRKINHNLYHLLMLSFQHEYWEKSTVCGWPMTTLGEVTSKFGTGLNPRKNFVLGQGSNYYVTIKNMGANRIFLDNRCDKIDDDAIEKIQKRSNLQVGDLLFSGIGTIGRVYLIDKPISNWNTSESIFNLHPIQNISSEFLYLLLLNDDMQKYAVSLASGSVQKGIRMADLKRYKFPLPPNDVMNQLTNLWAPIIQKIKTYEDENDHLASLRDTLLPKLMSGEIDVSQVEI